MGEAQSFWCLRPASSSFTSAESFEPRTSQRGHGRCPAGVTGGVLTGPGLTRPGLSPARPQLSRSAASRHTFSLHAARWRALSWKTVRDTQIKKQESGEHWLTPTFAWMPCADAGQPEIIQTILALQTSRHPVSPRRRRPSATQASLQIRGVSYQKMLCIPPHLLQRLMWSVSSFVVKALWSSL